MNTEVPSSPRDCPHWDKGCSAPLCPLEPKLDNMFWYTDEEVCHSRRYSNGLFWVTKQKEVARKVESTDTLFNVQMLRKDFAVTKTLEGCDPDSTGTLEEDVKKWLRKHPAKVKRKKLRKTEAASKQPPNKGSV